MKVKINEIQDTSIEEIIIGVKVIKLDGNNVFIFYNIDNENSYLYGDSSEVLNIYKGVRYKFDLSNYSNTGHPLRFSKSPSNSEVNDTEVSGSPGQQGSYVIFEPKSVMDYYVFCSNHGYEMGKIYNPITVQSNIMNTKVLNHNYRIDRDDPLLISGINNTFQKFYIEVVNTFKNNNDSEFKFKYLDNEIEVNLANDFLKNRIGSENMLVESDILVNSLILEDYNFNIVNNIVVSNFTYEMNILNFNINEDITFSNDQYVDYSLIINSTEYNLSNNDISFQGNNTSINLSNTIASLQSNLVKLNNLTNTLDQSTSEFRLKQNFSKKLPLIDMSYNQTMFVSLSEKYLFQDENKQQNFSIQLLDESGMECGNYVYKFAYAFGDSISNDSNTKFFYNTKNRLQGDVTKEIKYLGIYQNFFLLYYN